MQSALDKTYSEKVTLRAMTTGTYSVVADAARPDQAGIIATVSYDYGTTEMSNERASKATQSQMRVSGTEFDFSSDVVEALDWIPIKDDIILVGDKGHIVQSVDTGGHGDLIIMAN